LGKAPWGEEEIEDREAPIWDHIMELLERLRKAAIAVVVASLVLSVAPASLTPYTPLVFEFTRFIVDSVVPDKISVFGVEVEVALIQTSPFSGLLVLIKSALLLGLLAASPIIAWELYAFVRPALYPHEKFMLKVLGAASVLSFIFGALVAFKVVIPLGFRIAFLTSAALFGDRLVAFADVNRILTVTILGVVGIGLLYEAPILLYMLVRTGAVSPDVMSGEKGKIVLVALLIAGAVISPDGTGIGMLALALPLYLGLKAAAWLGARGRRAAGGHPTSPPSSPPSPGGREEAPQAPRGTL
jgi:sec-independent protein translocase protein TatC